MPPDLAPKDRRIQDAHHEGCGRHLTVQPEEVAVIGLQAQVQHVGLVLVRGREMPHVTRLVCWQDAAGEVDGEALLVQDALHSVP